MGSALQMCFLTIRGQADRPQAQQTEDIVMAAAYAWRHFVACVELLPAAFFLSQPPHLNLAF